MAGTMPLGVRAAESLTTGADFLLMTTGARPDGMGQAFSAVADDINTLSFNPAGLGNIRLPEIGYGHEIFFSDITYDFLGAAIPVGEWGVFGFGYLGLGTSPFNSTSDPNAVPASVMDQAVIGSWGKSFYDFHLGASVKYISEKVATVQGSGFAADFGFRVRLLPQWTLAGAVLNMGPGIQFASLEPLPLVTNGGLAWTAIEDPDHTLNLATEVTYNTVAETTHFGFGAEYWFQNLVALRAGYLANSQDEGFAVGAGFQYQFFQLDYAFEPYNLLGSVHRFSGILRWDGPWVSGGEPNAPRYLSVQASGKNLEIRWDKAVGPVEGYEVMIQPLNGGAVVVSPRLSNPFYEFKNCEPYTLYKVSVLSIGYGAARSFPSKAAYVSAGDQEASSGNSSGETMPSLALGLTGKVDGIGLRLNWNTPAGLVFSGYNLYRQSPSGQVEKVTQELKHHTTLWVMDTSGLEGWTWYVTGVSDNERETTLGAYRWFPSPDEIEALSNPATLRMNASPQPHRRVYLDWDRDRSASGYTLFMNRAGDGVYERFKDVEGLKTNLLLSIGGGRSAYYFMVGTRNASGQWLNHTKEVRAEIFKDMPDPYNDEP
jgi:hypothetical protein